MTTDALHPLETKLAAAWPPHDWREVTVLLAVSGGADSVALLRAVAALKMGTGGASGTLSPKIGAGRLVVAHLNHQLRPRESDADEAFVVDLCRRLGVACEVGRVRIDLASPAGGDGLEAAARQARYEFLEAAAARVGARYVATAHTADDQAETILHRIVRGTGIGGLAGMARARRLGPATLLRPLLGFRRRELLAYLADRGQPYCEDSSNANTRFTRNRIRHELVPQLAAQFNPGVVDAVLRLGSLAGEVQGVIETLADALADRCVSEESPDAIRVEAVSLAGQPSYLVREMLMAAWRRQDWPMQAMGFAEWNLLAQMLAAGTPYKNTFPGDVSVQVVEGGLRLDRGGR